MPPMATHVILHNIRSAHNVGSIFRTADGAGVKKIYLVGYTPAPIDRFGRVNDEIRKTALGAAETVPWEISEDGTELFENLRQKGVRIIAVEQTPVASDYRAFTPEGDTAYVFGNEVEGVPGDVCALANAVIHIPMSGMKESLNVSVAVGIILFHAKTDN